MIHENIYSAPALFFISALLIGWYVVHRLRYRHRLAKLGASPPMLPYSLPFGIDTLLTTINHNRRNANFELVQGYFDKLRATTVQLTAPGVTPIITIDPENIKAILATQFSDFGKGEEFHRAWSFFLGDGIFNADGHIWSEARALLRPQFHKQRVSDLHVFENHISKMIALLPKDGRTVDLMEWWHRFTLDASTEYLFGESVESLVNPKTSFAQAFSMIQKIQSMRSRMGPFWRIYYPKEFTESMEILNRFIEPFVERALSQCKADIEAKENSGQPVNFTDSLSLFTRNRTVLRDQLVSTLLAGRDTTACTLSWLFYELSYHPEIYANLREEVLSTLGTDGKPTYEHLKSMKFLQYCLNETLRLYPIVPFNVRTALVDTTLPRGGGPHGDEPIAVLKDTPCSYVPYLMQHRRDLFGPTVDEFNPSRWTTWMPIPWTYIPFNGGPRICLGQNFALTEMAYATARMCQVFERIEERTGEKRGSCGYRTDIVLSPLKGVKVGLIPNYSLGQSAMEWA